MIIFEKKVGNPGFEMRLPLTVAANALFPSGDRQLCIKFVEAWKPKP